MLGGPSQCVGALTGVDMGIGRAALALGESFMKTVFSVEEPAVGLAKLA